MSKFYTKITAKLQKFIEAQAKKGAEFYYNKKEITAAKAISIINNDKEINISSLGLVVNLSTEPINSNENKDEEKKLQEKATPKQVTEYNTLAKRYNKQSKKGMLVKLKEVNRIEYLYKLMTPSQKKKAEKFPSFPPMPPSPKVIKGVNDKESNIPPPPAPPKMPKNADYVVDNKKVSYDEASKIKDNEIESVAVATKDANGNKLKKSVIYINTKDNKIKVSESDKNLFRNDLGEIVRQSEWNYFVNNKKVTHKAFQSIDENDIKSVNVVKRDSNGDKLKVPSIYVHTKSVN